MSNELQQHKKSDKIKWIATALAVVILGIGVTASLTQGFKNWNPYGWFDNKQEQPAVSTETSDSGGAVIEESTGNGVKLTTRRLTSAEYGNYGVSPLAETAYTLTATVTPAEAVNKKVDWSVSFKNANSTWAAGKKVTDYVTVTPTSDGSLTATVANLGEFGEQIKITVTSRDNPTAKAECTVDYQQKFQSLTGYISLDTASETKADFSSSADTRLSIDFPLADNSQKGYLGTHTSEISITPIGTNVYTLSMEYEITKVEMKLASNVSRGLSESSMGFSTSHGELSTLSGVTYKNGKCTGKMQEFMGIADYSNGNVSVVKANLYRYTNGGNDTDRLSEYKIHYTVNGEEKVFSFYLAYSLASLSTAVGGIELNDGSIVF